MHDTILIAERLGEALSDAFLAAARSGEPLTDRQRDLIYRSVVEVFDEPAGRLIPTSNPGERVDKKGHRWYSADYLSDRIRPAAARRLKS